jgi:HSP20 family molecular chaperone IbpA
MEARLHSIDYEREFWELPRWASKGKKSWIATDEIEVKPSGGQLVVTAASSEYIGSGDRGGIPKNIRRTLTLWLSPRDLKRMVDAAFRAGLLSISTELPKQRKTKRAAT